MPQTSNHGYNVPNKGDANWHKPLNDNFRQYDTDIEVRDADGNKGNYTPKQGAKFLATDTGVVYAGDGSNWTGTLAQSRYKAPSASGSAGNLVAGHPDNSVASGISGATIAGGGLGSGRNEVTASFGTVSGGAGNTVSGLYGTVGGGGNNSVSGRRALVAGGNNNQAGAKYATVGGGFENDAIAEEATVAGGSENEASGAIAAVAGGAENTASGSGAFVGGGQGHTASHTFATVAGGASNTASADWATVAGGAANVADGEYGFAAGRNAECLAQGSFVWGDGTTHTVQSKQTNEFVAQAGGGFTFWSSSDFSTGAQLKSGSGSWSAWSSRTAKSNVTPVDPGAALEGVRDLEIATWNYDGQDESVRHMGPMAEDFADEFGLGGDRERIANVDADGVAFAAIQALADRLEERDETIEHQRDRIEELESTNEALEARLAAVEAELGLDADADAPAVADD